MLDKDIDNNSSELLQQDKQDFRVENSQMTEKNNDSEEGLVWTQPSDEVFERILADDNRDKAKLFNQNQKWGPVMPLRRSSRRVDDGKKVMECAQEFKRKWYLEDNAGISKKPTKPHPVSKNLLLSVAKDIGIDIEDGHPVLDKMVQLDLDRMGEMFSKGSHASCSSKADTSSLGSQVNSNNMDGDINTPEKSDQDGNPDLSKEDQELGWSKVGPRRKNKKRYK